MWCIAYGQDLFRCITMHCSEDSAPFFLQVLSRWIWSSAHPAPRSQWPLHLHPGPAASSHSCCQLKETHNMIMLKFVSVNEADVLCLMNGERNKKWMWKTNIQKRHLLQWTIEILFIQDVAFSVIGQKSVSVLAKFNEQMQLSLIFLVFQNLSPRYL